MTWLKSPHQTASSHGEAGFIYYDLPITCQLHFPMSEGRKKVERESGSAAGTSLRCWILPESTKHRRSFAPTFAHHRCSCVRQRPRQRPLHYCIVTFLAYIISAAAWPSDDSPTQPYAASVKDSNDTTFVSLLF